ncbi:unnamed protein product [Durusdinium trenchii]|uniref:Uncharacterized protein n=1 Tax=Durusdinium trenchii TaxID=1381693 RepID=A0ABP0L580_9DINO
MGLGVFLTCWLISQLRGDKMSLDTVFQLGGVLVFALFISITLAVLDPFLCIQNPDGSSSMASSPGVVCFNSEEHVWLAFLSSLGILCYPLLVLSWATFTTLMYPSRINSGAGLKLVRRHGFLFQRFTRECYFYGTLLLLRNIIVSLVPVAFAAVPEVQMVIMGAVLVTFGAVQVRLWPWRTTLANYTDLAITFILQVVLLGIAPLLEVEEGVSTEILGWILTFSVLSPFVAGIAASTFCVLCHFHPPLDYGIFLCHHKGGAGSLCRLIKLLISNHSKTRVFLDSDELEDLDLIFDTIRLKTRSVVVVLTPELLTRMWCAGEIVTAFKNKVITVPLICDGYLPPSTADIEGIPEVWTVQQKQILSFYGITMEDVQRAYAWLHDELEALILSRFAPPHHRENTVVELLSMVRAPMLYFRSMDGTKAANHKVKARVLITGAVSDGEALATLEVFQIMLQKQLHKECAVVQTPTALVAYKPWAYYFVILLSRGMLRDPGFAETLLSAYVEGEGVSSRPLEMVTVNADTHFEFPSAEFYRDLEEHSLPGVELHLGPHLSKVEVKNGQETPELVKQVQTLTKCALIQLDLDDLSEASDDHPLITESATAEVQATAPWPEGPDVSGPLAEGRGLFGSGGKVASRALRLASKAAEVTQLSSYVFSSPPQDGEAMSQLMLGPASLVNHGVPEMVNCDLIPSEGFVILRPREGYIEGEELFISYGTSEWFTDRGLVSQSAKPAQLQNSTGMCLSKLRADTKTADLLAASSIATEERIMTPAFLIPKDVADPVLLDHALPIEEVLLLPLWPGRINEAEPPNVELQVMVDGLPIRDIKRKAQELCDAPGIQVDVVMTALRDILEGEKIRARPCGEGCLAPLGWARQISEARHAAAEAGDVQAQFQLAQRYRQGMPNTSAVDSSQALIWYTKAAQQNHTAAMLQLGAMLHDGDSLGRRDPYGAFEWYLAAAKQGSATGQFLVGLAYTNGDGVEKNISEASVWLSHAAAQGSSNFAKASKAMYNLAIAYREGLGIAPDLQQAFYWCRKAAEEGNHDKAMFNLAVAYSRGDGTAVDSKEAVRWYRRAAEMGHVMAQYNLGYAYLVGEGVARSDELAAKWFQDVAESGRSNGRWFALQPGPRRQA